MAGLSKLEAVNLMLSNIGESPVSTLEGASGDAFVASAISILDETNRDVQSESWEFNRDVDYVLTPDINNNILITDDMLAVDTSTRSGSVDVTVRNGMLYNKTDHTFVFNDPLYCDVDWEFIFEETPQYIRQYIAVRAARVFARRMLGDVTGERLTEQDEFNAKAAAKRKDLANSDRNIFKYGQGIGRIKQRSM